MAAGLTGALWYRASRSRRSILAEMTRLASRALEQPPQSIDLCRFAGPEPVARYLRQVIRRDTAVRVAQLDQRGWLRTGGRSQRWMPFVASQVVSPGSCSFIWNASVGVIGNAGLRVLDRLIDGQGSGQVLLLSSMTIARSIGGHEMNAGALHRYLAETPWYPTALLPSPNLQWTPLDDSRAVATLSSGEASVSLEFRFGANGDLAGVCSPGRWGSFEGRFELRPWKGQFDKYEWIGGLKVPTQAAVGWYRNGQWNTAWAGSILRASYDSRPRGDSRPRRAG